MKEKDLKWNNQVKSYSILIDLMAFFIFSHACIFSLFLYFVNLSKNVPPSFWHVKKTLLFSYTKWRIVYKSVEQNWFYPIEYANADIFF